jgi:peptidoglycan/xylan/chitin deacetylase (PgdA/CDA1 family)
MRKSHLLAAALHRTGGTRLLDAYWGPNRLTVLAYHRIRDARAPDFDGYAPNVSATPEMFARQMDFVKQRFNVIDLAALRAFVVDGNALPPRPLLITFDDGYLDNYENAYPILRERNLPAVIFLITGRMGSAERPWWDLCAYYFHHTTQPRAALPLVGERDLSTPEARRTAREELMRKLKTLPQNEKQAAMDALPDVLEVAPPAGEPPLFVSWEQVRELGAHGIACQPHTVTHPILTRISLDDARVELAESRARIADETGQAIMAFAYPNGTPADYDATMLQVLRELDIPLAFTLTPGPVRLKLVQRHPLQIARVFLSYKDTFAAFVMKVMGFPALRHRPSFIQEPE